MYQNMQTALTTCSRATEISADHSNIAVAAYERSMFIICDHAAYATRHNCLTPPKHGGGEPLASKGPVATTSAQQPSTRSITNSINKHHALAEFAPLIPPPTHTHTHAHTVGGVRQSCKCWATVPVVTLSSLVAARRPAIHSSTPSHQHTY
jgi:hypothetical protein